jgi:1-acyl-sn-glycerol-3-phosphate acyltransferase
MGLYTSTQRLLRFGFWFFYHKVHIRSIENLPLKGPVLLVANHPNSFMDALLIGAYLKRPIHFLARGDAFDNPVLAKIFKAYNMLPVYRISEGKENIEKNFDTFDACYDALNKGGVVLIFGEGLCKNNWDLRPLKKGPARIAQRAWNGSDAAKDLVIVPVGLTYEHFDGGGKSSMLRYGAPITKNDLGDDLQASNFVQQLNGRIASSLSELAYVNRELKPETAAHDDMMLRWQKAEENGKDVLDALQHPVIRGGEENKKYVMQHKRWFTKIHAGVIALPHYWVCKMVAGKLTKGSVFYDSILYGLVLFLFPLYWLTVILLICYFI